MSTLATHLPRNHHGIFRAGMPAPYRHEDVRFFDKLDLAALRTAVPMSRQFTKFVLLEWRVPWLVEDATLITSELISNAVKNTGNMDEHPTFATLGKLPMVSVRLIGLEKTIVFEVWDVSKDVPVLQVAGPTDEGGRGLRLIDSLSLRWGYYPAEPGKVVWAELPVFPDPPTLSKHERPPDIADVLKGL
jgi:hypothetical protein